MYKKRKVKRMIDFKLHAQNLLSAFMFFDSIFINLLNF